MTSEQQFYIAREALNHLRNAQEYIDKLGSEHTDLGDCIQDVIEALEFVGVGMLNE